MHVEQLRDEWAVHHAVYGQQMAHHPDAGLVERADRGSAGPRRHEPLVLQGLQRLAHGSAIHAQPRGHVPLAGQPLAGLVGAAQDVIADALGGQLVAAASGSGRKGGHRKFTHR